MKTLSNTLFEKVKLKATKVGIRDSSDSLVHQVSSYKGKRIAWFSNKYNRAAGWNVFALDSSDLKWFKDQGESTKNVFRVATDKGTTLVKINLTTARMLWFDNETYMNTDKISWQKRWMSWETFIIDRTTYAFAAFNTDGIYKA